MDDVKRLREEAARCRRLAEEFSDKRTVKDLTELADDYERRARELEGRLPPDAGDGDFSDPAA